MTPALPLLPAKRVRFSPFITYIGEEPPPPEMEEGSMGMDSSSLMGVRRSIGGAVHKRASLDLNDLFLDKPFGTGEGCSLAADIGIGFHLAGSLREIENEDDSTVFGHESQPHSSKFGHSSGSFLTYDDSDCSFPDLGPLGILEDDGLHRDGAIGADTGIVLALPLGGHA